MRRGVARALSFALLVIALLAAAAPISAQTEPGAARVAPAIGPWLGAPRGSIEIVRAVDGGIEVEGLARDPDSASAIAFDIIVDGEVVGSGETIRPEGFGVPAEFSHLVNLDDGLHTVCLRLVDSRFGARTVDCTSATTAPPDTVDAEVSASATGALITETGVVVPVTRVRANGWEVTTPCGATATLTDGSFVDRARVVIDPGHGGSESGTTGGGILEKNLNLEISELVVTKLNALGISAQTTRTTDYRLPIRTRAEIATALAPDVFLSVHHNGGATRRSSRPGTEIFYSVDHPKSQRLAAILYEEMVDALSEFDAAWVSSVSEGASLRLREDGMDLYGIHRYSPDITSIITEALYLSNPSEATLLKREDVPELEAQTIVDSLLRWWWTDDAGTTRGREFVDSSSSGTGGFDGCVDPPLNAPNQPLVASREDVLTEYAFGLSAPKPAPSLLPALFLASDPALSYSGPLARLGATRGGS